MLSLMSVCIALGIPLLVHGRSAPSQSPQRNVVPIPVSSFRLSDVQLLEGPFKKAMEANQKYLRELEVDRMLHNFRVNAGLPSSAEPMGGWESPQTELRGHFVGHYLSACALMYASIGDTVLKANADTVVAELAKCQEKLGNGYLSAFPEDFITRVETGKRVWAPWYTLHKIMAGLLDMYVLCGNGKALDVVRKMAAWAKSRTDRLTDEQMQNMLKVEFGGMNEVLRNLYSVTGDPDYVALARRFDHKAVLDPLANHQDKLKGLHVNTQIPKIIGTARAYELTGDRYYYEIATYFWNQVVHARSYAPGGTSYDEHWSTEPYQLANQLGTTNHENCCTYNMLKLTRHLFTWNPDPEYADYYERALFNGILPTLTPDDGMIMYYVPMGSGWYKTFGSPRGSFWCCTGTGVESFSKLSNSIYFQDENGVYVNLFIASELNWPEKGVRIKQETGFPEQQRTLLRISTKKPIELSIHLRIPYWIQRGGQVRINGKAIDAFASPSSFLTVRRMWKDGDRIEVDLPMGLHLHRMPDNPNRAAIMFGPIVLAGELGMEGLTKEKMYGHYGPSGDPVLPSFFVAKSEALNSWIKPVEARPLTFQTVGAGNPKDVTLVPFYKLFNQRYAIYWDIYSESEWEKMKAESRALQAGMLDSVKVGDVESDREHNFQGYSLNNGQHLGHNWVSTSDWFSYDMKVSAVEDGALRCTYLSADTAKEYGIFVDGTRLKGEPSLTEKQGELVVVSYGIPESLTTGKKKAAFAFRTEMGQAGRKLFGCAIVKK